MMLVPEYQDGGEVRIGDRIEYAGQPGVIVCVIETKSYSPAFPEEWSFLNQGFMMDVQGMGLIHMDEVDEDLQLVARASG
jgi:hypothetical protein